MRACVSMCVSYDGLEEKGVEVLTSANLTGEILQERGRRLDVMELEDPLEDLWTVLVAWEDCRWTCERG
jgi:hypothetical protein